MKNLYELHKGNSKLILPELIKQGIQVDSIVTDPPYHLQSIVKRFGKTSVSDDNQTGENARNRATPGARLAKGFMGQSWDGGDIAQDVEFWKLCYDVLKPGGYLLAFSSTRTYHRQAVAIEDAGFEIRDQIGWLYGSGMPKSLNISKAIDKHLGKERTEVLGKYQPPGMDKEWNLENATDERNVSIFSSDRNLDILAPVSEEAKKWNGWYTSLKPAWEPIVVARKPLEEGLTNAENILKYGTGGLNIDACRVPSDSSEQETHQIDDQKLGRFPANVVHDGSEEVLEEFAKYGKRTSGRLTPEHNINESENRSMTGKNYERKSTKVFAASEGSAARFFYSAKANEDDRAGSSHPTVKPLKLMSYLVKLVTPPNGKVLDPFAGSGTTGQAAVENGFYPIMIEMTPEYQKDIERRMSKFETDAFYTLFE
jgi:DNA modification methylase